MAHLIFQVTTRGLSRLAVVAQSQGQKTSIIDAMTDAENGLGIPKSKPEDATKFDIQSLIYGLYVYFNRLELRDGPPSCRLSTAAIFLGYYTRTDFEGTIRRQGLAP